MIADIFNLSLSIETMDVHVCNESGCAGPKFGGLNINCGVCLLPYYYECLHGRDEFIHLLNEMNIEPMTNDDHDKINEAHAKVKKLFGATSIFEFICPACKGSLNSVSFYDIKSSLDEKLDKLKTDYDDLKKKNDELNAENKNVKSKNTKLNNDINAVKATLYDQSCKQQQTMQSQQSVSNECNSDIAILHSQIDEKKHMIESFSEDFKTVLAMQRSCLDAFRLDSENRIKHSMDLLNKLTSTVPVIEVSDEEHVDSNSMGAPLQSNQKEKSGPGFQLENSVRKTINDCQPFKNPLIVENRPRQQNAGEGDGMTKLYEIHISAFELHIECKDIVKFITARSAANNPKSFSVQLLGGNNTQRSFNSFKVSTFDVNVYNAVLSEDLWVEQKARPFNNSTTKQRENLHFKNPLSQQGNVDQRQISNYGHHSGTSSNFRSNPNNRYTGTDNNRANIPRFNKQRQRDNNDVPNADQNRNFASTSTNNDRTQAQTDHQQNRNQNQRNQNNFLQPNSNQQRQTNPFRDNNSSNRYRSTESIHSRG